MERRTFVKTVGATAAVGALGTGVSSAEIPEKGIEILTDEYNVSHVYADDIYDLGYGQGWVQARDRLFQIDLMRTVGRGKSAEVVGPGQIPSDISVRRDLYNEDELQEMWDEADGILRDAILGYTEGVNDKMEELREEDSLFSNDWPGEFELLGRDPPEWKPTDTVAVLSYAIGFFGVGGGSELSNAKTLAEMFDRFDSEKAAWEAYHDINKAVVPDSHYGSVKESEIDTTEQRVLEYDEVPEEQLETIRAARNTEPWGVEEFDIFEEIQEFFRDPLGAFQGQSFGSNAIIVDGEHTDTGKPMLGGGPQMSLLKPPVIHEVGLHGDGFDVAGIGVVGTPSVVVGRTPEFAWTVTTSGDDMVDTVAVDLHPNNRYKYKWDGEWHEMSVETYEHEPDLWAGIVEGEFGPQHAEQEVAYVEQEGTRMPVVAFNPDENVAFVQRTTTRMEELDGAFQWALLGRANNREEFEEYISEFPFGFNFHYIDNDEIAYYRTGKLVHPNNETDPRLPEPADLHHWDGFDVGTELGVNVVDPERGYVVNWNNAPAPGWRNNDAEQNWGTAHRVDVMESLMQELLEHTGGNLSLDHVDELIERCSVEHPFAPAVVPHLISAARNGNATKLDRLADELERWADRNYAFRPAADDRYPTGGMAIWEEVRHELQWRMFSEKLGAEMPELEFDPMAIDNMSGAVDPYVADHGPTNPKDIELVDTLEGRANYDWLGESIEKTLNDAMWDAILTLEERYGSENPSDWRMESRKTEFMALGGADADKIPITNRASYQQSIAMQNGPAVAGSVLPPSNVGHIGTWELLGNQTFFDEPDELTTQLDMYKNFDFKPHPVRRAQVEQHATDSQLLDPWNEIDDGEDDDDGGLFGGGGPGFTLPAVGAALGSAALIQKLREEEPAE